MIFEWMPSDYARNYGDALTSFLAKEIYKNKISEMEYSTDNRYFLIGSVISNSVIKETLNLGLSPVFIGCGWRGESLSTELLKECKFIGVRGPETRNELLRHGIEVEVVGDPAYLVFPKFKIKPIKKIESLLIPHVLDRHFNFLKSEAKDFTSAYVYSDQDVINLTKKIASSNFVLSGAMHVCMAAHYFGIPFAPYSGGRIDCKPKWTDWLESVGVSGNNLKFCSNVQEGVDWYKNVFDSRKN